MVGDALAMVSAVQGSDTRYCRTLIEESGSAEMIRTFVYTTESQTGSVKLWFTLAYQDCDVLSDREATVCQDEQAELDELIDQLLRAGE